MQRKGKELIKQVKTLTNESEYNSTQNKNLETMIQHMDQNLQMIVAENVNLRKEFNEKITKKNEEIFQMRDIAERIIHGGDMELFNSILSQAQKSQNSEGSENLMGSQWSSYQSANNTSRTQPKSKGANYSSRNVSKNGNSSNLSKTTKKKKRSSKTVSKEEEANLIMRIAELKRENEALRKQNSKFREKWLQQSLTESQMDKHPLLLPDIPGRKNYIDDDSIFFDEQTPISSQVCSNSSFNTFTTKEGVYQNVKKMSKQGHKFKKGKKKYKQKDRMREAEEALNRTTLRKTLGSKSVRGRHAQYSGENEKNVYCQLI